MAYDKKYPEIDDFILDFDKGQEDRIDKAFGNVVLGSRNIKIAYIGTKLTVTTDIGGYCGFDIPYNENSVVIAQLTKVNDSTITADYYLTSFPNRPVYRHTLWRSGAKSPNTKIEANVIVISWD